MQITVPALLGSVVCFFLLSQTLFSQTKGELGNLRIGVGFKNDAVFISEGGLTPQDDEPSAVLSSFGGRLTGESIITLAPSFFSNSSFGLDFTLGFREFSTVVQSTDIPGLANTDPVFMDLDTFASGEIFFLTPRFFYSFYRDDYSKQYFTVGLGLGVGLFNIKGQAYLTNGDVSEECRRGVRNHKVSEIKSSCSLIKFEETWRNAYSFSNFIMWRSSNFYISYESDSVVNLRFLEEWAGEQGGRRYAPIVTLLVTGIVIDF